MRLMARNVTDTAFKLYMWSRKRNIKVVSVEAITRIRTIDVRYLVGVTLKRGSTVKFCQLAGFNIEYETRKR